MESFTFFSDYVETMQSLFTQNVLWFGSNLSLLVQGRGILDVLIVTVIFYALYLFFRETRAFHIFIGLALLFLVAQVSQFFQLAALTMILQYVLTILLVAIPVVFQPELRNALERLGRKSFRLGGHSFFAQHEIYENNSVVQEAIVEACLSLAESQHGALIVFERETGLKEYFSSGVVINADVSAFLLRSLFYPKNPLHDGAVIIKNHEIIAASCTLPLTEKRIPQGNLRHKAAVGLTEQSDAVVLLVSEERGEICKVEEGKVSETLTEIKLKNILKKLYPDQPPPGISSWWDMLKGYRSLFRKK